MPRERLTQQDRRRIAAALREGLTYAAIGRRIGRPTSTITREVLRNGGPGSYHADQAHRASTQPSKTAAPRPTGRAEFGGRDPRIVQGVAAHSMELFVRTGMPRMMATVLAALLTTDSGSLTSAELVRRLRVSPASVSKAVGYLDAIGIIKRERDSRRRVERYVIDDDVWFQAVMASSRIDAEIAAACSDGARRLGATTPAGVRLERMGQFLHHVGEDLVRSATHWREVYSATGPRTRDAEVEPGGAGTRRN
ncbi:helix-turn-helix domain-containing protein [Nocardia sp. NPDC052566]|uniref:GbsR/MarR family transcriptional regulator n=1 Tax=Nocardia sp. NPDC052566 TaxID=3364330 RepID=UPI0037CA0B4B